jgi:hypothetical protein
MLYVAEVSGDPGHDMYWNDWVIIDSDAGKAQAERALAEVPGSADDDRTEADLDAIIISTFHKHRLSINSIRHAECISSHDNHHNVRCVL